MDILIKTIEKLIKKNHNKAWNYPIDLLHSCIHSHQYKLLSANIFGDGSIHDIVKIKIEYMIHNSEKINTRFKKVRGIESAIKYVWDFPENFNLCLNCCNLVKKNEQCEKCIFFKSYLQYKNKTEICCICQEETHRTILQCKHHFHKSCILKMNPDDDQLKCPLCRFPLNDDIVYDFFDNDNDEDIIEEVMSDDDI